MSEAVAQGTTTAAASHAESVVAVMQRVSMRYPIPRSIKDRVLRPLSAGQHFTALEDVDLEVHAGDRIALLGPNGAGKTTLLKLISGLLLPSAGEVWIDGYSTTRSNGAARRSVGYVINDERSFFWRLTGRQNLAFFGALENLHGRDLRDKIDELLAAVGISNAADRPFSSYSSGMKQRLAMVRGLLSDPEVLILDEPTRALDPLACDELIDLILGKIQHRERRALLIATHRFEEVERLCERVLVIYRGRIVALEDLANLAARGESLPAFYRRSLGLAK